MKVLVADDDPGLRSELEELLASAGHRATVVENGEQVLARLRASSYDIVLLDWMMPGPSGTGLVRRVKELQPDVAIIVMTGYGDVDTAIAAFRSGAVDFLPKPFDFEAVQRAFAAAGRRPRDAAEGKAARGRERKRSHPDVDIRAAFLNYRNGTLVAHRIQPREKMVDEDLFAATLDIIQNFMRTSFPVLRGKRLRAIVQGDHTLLIERGRYVYLSLVVRGSADEGLRRRMRARLREFEARNEDALRAWRGEPADAKGIEEVFAPFFAS